MSYSEERYDAFAKEMQEAYPVMFSQPYGGFAIGEGWWDIIKALCFNIQSHQEHILQRIKYNTELNGLIDAYKAGDTAGLEEYCKYRSIEDVLENGYTSEEDLVPPEPVIVQQIKEKFGGLRFYYSGGDEYIHGLVSMAEAWAGRSCETCGNKGERRNGGWIRTLCDEHEAEHQKAKNA